jgi:hypothetical protein
MTGPGGSCPLGSFNASRQTAGGCTVTYSLSGTFVTANAWQGTYQLTFSGPDCSCFGGAFGSPCVNQSFNLQASR